MNGSRSTPDAMSLGPLKLIPSLQLHATPPGIDINVPPVAVSKEVMPCSDILSVEQRLTHIQESI